MTKRPNESGFTLIELTVAMVVFGIVAAIAFPATFTAQREVVNLTVRTDVVNTRISVEEQVGYRGKDIEAVERFTTDASTTVEVTLTENAYTVTGTNSGTGYSYTYDSKTDSYIEG